MAEKLVITPYQAYLTPSQPHISYRTAKLQVSSSRGAVTLWKHVPSFLISCVCGVLDSNTNHLEVLPREPGGLQFAQHQCRAEIQTDLGQELAQHMLDKLPQVMVAILAVHKPQKANSSDDNTLRKGKKYKVMVKTNHILTISPSNHN